MNKYQLITILGPTASGKTSLAALLAHQLDTEIISADSRQVYRNMDIGTGKDLADYVVDGVLVPYHVIDICDAGTKYNLFEYQKDFYKAYQCLTERGKMPILCGGTGMYMEAVLKGFQLVEVPPNAALRDSLRAKTLPELERMLAEYKTMHNKSDVDSVQRAIRAIEIAQYTQEHPFNTHQFPPLTSLIVGLELDRDVRRKRISDRLEERLNQGMIAEVAALIQRGIAPEDLIYYGLEYKYITQYWIGQLTYDQMVEQLEIAIHRFAKRQMTWFRGMERRGFQIHWIDALLPNQEKVSRIKELLQ